jgi:hypothetical protein
MNKGEMMHIIYDPQFDEYGVLMNENFKKVLKKTHEDFAKVAPTLGDQFVFSTGGEPVAPLDMNAFPKEILNSDIPVIKFYDENKNETDTAMYTSQIARERYQKIKEINNLKEFFKFRKEKVSN